jgi:hypothetical protein
MTMNVYLISTSLELKGGAIDWSETTKRRKPDPNAVRWYPSDSDYFKLGPLPDELRQNIERHWALAMYKPPGLPRKFKGLKPDHFTGLPAFDTGLKDFWASWAGEDSEIIEVPKLWSLPEKRVIEEPYYFVNVYGAETTLDIKGPGIGRVNHEKMRQVMKYHLSYPIKARLVENFSTSRQLWRDSNTSSWLCGDAFKDAMTAFEPDRFEFTQIPAAGD